MKKTVEFSNPVYVGKRDDTDILRKKIIDMSYTDGRRSLTCPTPMEEDGIL